MDGPCNVSHDFTVFDFQQLLWAFTFRNTFVPTRPKRLLFLEKEYVSLEATNNQSTIADQILLLIICEDFGSKINQSNQCFDVLNTHEDCPVLEVLFVMHATTLLSST